MKQVVARHVLHDDIRQPVIRGTTIMKRGDIRMVERRQDLPLIAESRQDGGVVRLEAQKLESDMFAELIVVATRQKNRAHAASAQELLDSVRPQAASYPLM